MNEISVTQLASAWPQEWQGSATTPIGVDEAFNGYLAAQIVFALDRLGLLDLLLECGQAGVGELAADVGAAGSNSLLTEILRAAAACGYLTLRGGVVALTEAGREMARLRGYFTWAVGGYAGLFASMGDIAVGRRRFNHDVFRDEAMVALGSGQNDQAQLAGLLDGVLKDVDFTSIADLGSGACGRLCRVVSGREGARGLGLDISTPATGLAEATIGAAGLGGRVKALQRDILELFGRREHDNDLHEVDAVMSFFLLHDLLADPDTRAGILPELRKVFPKARTFIFADTMLRPATRPDRPARFLDRL